MSEQIPTDLELPATSGKPFKLSRLKHKLLALYFYPKDNTPGCTNEALQFRDRYAEFQALGCEVIGVSRDSLKSHENFKAKHELPFELISDPDELVCQLFGVMKLKNMYGKKVRGIERSTFLLNKKGQILHEWRGVKVPNHVQDILDYIQDKAC